MSNQQLSEGAMVPVADDDAVLRRMVRRMLEQEHVAVVEAQEGEHAIRIIDHDEAHLLDAVLTDLDMPIVSGPELITVLQECRPDLPVVAMSGSSELPPALATVPLLYKPFPSDDLLGAVAPLVLRSREMRARARQVRADAAESRVMAQRQTRIAKQQYAASSELMVALFRLRQRML